MFQAKPFIKMGVCLLICAFTQVAYGYSEAPVAQMYSHAHHDESVMVSWQTMYSSAEGLRHGDSPLSNATTLEHFNHSPISMHMTMSMVDVMKAINDKWTVMAMLPYTLHDMKMATASGDIHSHKVNGIGDVSLSSLYTLVQDQKHEFFWITGVTLPSGSIDEKDDDGERLSYPMQLGSGTIDLQTGFTVIQNFDKSQIGLNTLGTFRTGMNKNGYRLGDKFEASLWASHVLRPSVRGVCRAVLSGWGDIHGEDEALDPVHSGIYSHHKHTDALNTVHNGGTKLDVSLGLNKTFERVNVGLEVGVPVIQHYGGYVMNQTWWSSIGIQALF